MSRVPLPTLLVAALFTALSAAGPQQPAQQKQTDQPAQQAQAAQAGQPPRPAAQVTDAVAFRTRDGKFKGWKVVVPGGRPLATPAVVDGKVLIGGGFGSHEFYAFDADTGKKLWQYQTKDDGPTAGVVQGGYLAFNTESCELEILALDGKPVWKKWLGDPLMSMPAIDQGKVYMAYPDSKGDKRHYLACFVLKTGKQLWKRPIAGEVITAPVVAEEHVYLATLDGTLYCFGQHDGELIWQERKNATSSPVVWNKECHFSRRSEITIKQAGKGPDVRQQREQLAGRSAVAKSAPVTDNPATARDADYLDAAKKAHTAGEKAKQAQDAGVGFGGAKGDAKIAQALENLGESSVAGVWAYQGSKPFVYRGRLYSCMGDTVQCVDLKSGKVVWKRTVHEKKGPAKDTDKGKKQLLESVLTPPALVNGKVFLGTTFGEVYCLSAESGEVHWSAAVGEPVVFQPAVAGGRVYVSTNRGKLFCLETGDAKDDGWLMWGATAAHNGLPK